MNKLLEISNAIIEAECAAFRADHCLLNSSDLFHSTNEFKKLFIGKSSLEVINDFMAQFYWLKRCKSNMDVNEWVTSSHAKKYLIFRESYEKVIEPNMHIITPNTLF